AAGLEVFEQIEQASGLAPFDCITLWHSLEHLQDPLSSLKSAVSLLRPQGWCIIAVPDGSGLQARMFGAEWLHLDVPRHLFHFNSQSLRQLLETTGFEIRQTWHQEFEYDAMGWVQSALNKLLPTPNVFFQTLTGKPSRAGAAQKTVSLAAALVLGFP